MRLYPGGQANNYKMPRKLSQKAGMENISIQVTPGQMGTSMPPTDNNDKIPWRIVGNKWHKKEVSQRLVNTTRGPIGAPGGVL